MTKPGYPAQNVEKQVTLEVGATTQYATTAGKRVTSPENAAAREPKAAKAKRVVKEAKAQRVVKEAKAERVAKEAKETPAPVPTHP